tara:strand:+ start:49 stop:948 length:900 start_codon:yes stop_codon:yes gene_type:complete
MKKVLLLTLFILVALSFDFIIPLLYPLYNKDSYFLGFHSFLKKAEETKGKNRIILVGGSSLGWGVSAKELTQSLGILTLNSGIHAGVGYKNFLRNISHVIDKENDILVISPEYSILSKFGRSKEFCEISIYVRGIYPIDCIGYSLNSLFRIFPLYSSIKSKKSDPKYIRTGFNEFGDYSYRIPGVSMLGKKVDNDYCESFKIEDLNKKYIPYIEKLVSEGYEIVYLPNFLINGSCSNVQKIRLYHNILFDKFGISPYREAGLLFNEKYFYDTNYHLTEKGVSLKTQIFEKQLKRYLKNK